MDKRLSKFAFKDIPNPYEGDEAGQSRDYKALFTTPLGERVLDSIMIDADYHKPDFPGGVDVTAQLGFNAGKRYVVNHMLAAIAADYEEIEEEGGIDAD